MLSFVVYTAFHRDFRVEYVWWPKHEQSPYAFCMQQLPHNGRTQQKKKRRTSSKNCGRIFSMHLNIKRFSPSAFIAGYRSSSILMRHAWAGNTQYTKRLCDVIRAVERAKKSMRKRFSFHKSIPFFCAHSFIHPRGTSHHCHSRQRLRTQFEPLLFGVALNIWMSPKRRVWCGSEFPSSLHCPHPDSDNLSFPSVLVVRRGGVAIYIHI